MSANDDRAALLALYDDAHTLLESRLPDWLLTPQPAVSGWSAAQHFDHVERINRAVLTTLHRLAQQGADAIPESARRGGLRRLEAGRFERGLARAPEFATPPPDPSLDDLRATLARNRVRWAALDVSGFDRLTGTFPHPLLGPFTAVQWVRFVYVHTAHHHAIVGELR